MIPQFPEFKKLEITDKQEFAEFTLLHPPYSDFNFVSMWSYDTKGEVEVARMGSNLVVKFVDYISNEKFLMLLGEENLDQGVEILLDQGKGMGLVEELRLVPETVVKRLTNGFVVEEDMDNHDYILSVKALAEGTGRLMAHERQFVNQFQHHYGDKARVYVMDLKDKYEQERIIRLFEIWEQVGERKRSETERELEAIKKLLNWVHEFELLVVGVEVDGELVGFSIQEIVHDKYAMLHFEKADKRYAGVFQYLKQQTAQLLLDKGVEFINYEQDLGIPGLRKAKLSYRPVHFLKKYKVRRGGQKTDE